MRRCRVTRRWALALGGATAAVLLVVVLARGRSSEPVVPLAATTPAAAADLASALPGAGWRTQPAADLRRLTVDDSTALPLVRASEECAPFRDLERQLILQNASLASARRDVAERAERGAPGPRLTRATRTTADFSDAAAAVAGLAAARAALEHPAFASCIGQGAAARGFEGTIEAIPFPRRAADSVAVGLRLVGPEGAAVAEEYLAWWVAGSSLRALTISVAGPALPPDAIEALAAAARGLP